MNSITVSLIVFMCVFGGTLIGMLLRAALPEDHLSSDSKDIVKLGMGLVGTMAALVLGLLVASAKGSFDAQANELTQLSANVVLLDRILAHYGPETKEVRDLLREAVARLLDRMWSKAEGSSALADPASGGDALFERIQELSPQTEKQRWLHTQAVNIAIGLGQTRWSIYEQTTASVSVPLLVVLVSWLTLIQASFGLFAPFNSTVIGSLCVSALSVSAAIFLILEMYAPFSGMIQLSSAPLGAALAHLGQ